MIDSITYKNKTFDIISDKSITEPCSVCDFKPYCNDYINEESWLACGAITPNHIYLKNNGRNN